MKANPFIRLCRLFILCSVMAITGCTAQLNDDILKDSTVNQIADSIQNSTPENQRWLIFGVWNFNITSVEELKTAAKAALANGFNAIRIHIPWFHAETEPGVYTFDIFNKQLDYLVVEKNIKVVVTVDFTRRTGADRVISPDECQYDNRGVLCSGGAFFDRTMISFSSASAVRKANEFYDALCRNLISRYKDNILLISPVFSQYAESEYWCTGNYDYSDNAKSGFVEFLQSKYSDITALNHTAATSYSSFNEIKPPDNFAGNIGLLWYQYRHVTLKAFIDSLCDTQKAVDDTVKIGLQYGSVFDEASVQRGTLAFADLSEKADVMWVDDGPGYDHNWSMDYIASVLKPLGKQTANEIDGYYHIQNGNCTIEDYLNQGIQSFTHGADYLTVANWSIDRDFYDNAGVFRTISEYIDRDSMLPTVESPVLKISLYDMFTRRSPATYISKYNKLTENGKFSCNIEITDDLTQKIPDDTAIIYMFPASFSDSEQGVLSYRSYDRQSGSFGEMQWSDQYNAWQGDAEFCLVGSGMMHPDTLDSAIVFTAPKDGSITYSFTATVTDKNSDGVRISVLHNGAFISPEQHLKDEGLEAEISADVKKGDEVALICNKYRNNSFDSTNVAIDISY